MSELPDAVIWNWNNAAHQQQRATVIAQQLTAKTEEINRAKRALADLTAEHLQMEEDHDKAKVNALLCREMAEGYAAKHKVQLPPIPPEVPLNDTAAFPAVAPQAQPGPNHTQVLPAVPNGR